MHISNILLFHLFKRPRKNANSKYFTAMFLITISLLFQVSLGKKFSSDFLVSSMKNLPKNSCDKEFFAPTKPFCAK